MSIEFDNLGSNIRAATLLQAIINAIPAPLFFKDEHGIYLGCNDAFGDFVGLPKETIIGKDVFQLWDQDKAQIYYDADKELFDRGGKQVYEGQVIDADGQVRDVVFYKAVFDVVDDISGLVGVMLDVTDRKQAERHLKKISETDSLTGLYNRAKLYSHLETIKHRELAEGEMLGVMVLDLDQFKPVNDQYGHAMGDSLLVEVAKRMQAAVRRSDLVARMGGDEFCIVLEGFKNRSHISEVAKKLISHISAPYSINGHSITIGTSIGIMVGESRETNCGISMLKRADLALYKAKARGKGTYEYAD